MKKLIFAVAVFIAVFPMFADSKRDVGLLEDSMWADIDAERDIIRDTIVDGAHVIDVSRIDKRLIRDKFIIVNETAKKIQVNVYYKSSRDAKWRFCGSDVIDPDDSEDIDSLEEKVFRTPYYAIRIKGDSGSNYQVTARPEHHDLRVYIGESF